MRRKGRICENFLYVNNAEQKFCFLRQHELGARIKTIKRNALSFSMGNSTYFIHYYFICTYSVFHCKKCTNNKLLRYKIGKKKLSQ